MIKICRITNVYVLIYRTALQYVCCAHTSGGQYANTVVKLYFYYFAVALRYVNHRKQTKNINENFTDSTIVQRAFESFVTLFMNVIRKSIKLKTRPHLIYLYTLLIHTHTQTHTQTQNHLKICYSYRKLVCDCVNGI